MDSSAGQPITMVRGSVGVRTSTVLEQPTNHTDPGGSSEAFCTPVMMKHARYLVGRGSTWTRAGRRPR
jgi:hypothetical protein